MLSAADQQGTWHATSCWTVVHLHDANEQQFNSLLSLHQSGVLAHSPRLLLQTTIEGKSPFRARLAGRLVVVIYLVWLCQVPFLTAFEQFLASTYFCVLMRSAMRVLCFRSRALRRRYIGCAFGVVALLVVSLLKAHEQLPIVWNISCKNDFSAEGIRKIVSSCLFLLKSYFDSLARLLLFLYAHLKTCHIMFALTECGLIASHAV